jgi:RND superfamily putative drug exporter
VIQTHDRLQAAFPGGAVPAETVIKAADVTAAPVRDAIRQLHDRALATGELSEPSRVEVSPDKTVAVVALSVKGSGTDAASERSLQILRNEVVPVTVGRLAGAEVAVTGLTAGSKDFNDSMLAHAPLVFAFVLALAFVLLLATFRSIVIPLTAIALNLLSVGAAYGLLVLIFQGDWAERPLDFTSNHAITSWLPMFLFVVLFGLSMDYHVFILSRIKELHDSGLSTEEAVARGIRRTAGTVTSAAIIMVAVFAIFATLQMIQMKQLGIGLGLAVLIDATVIRGVLLPATMKLLGDWNWYMPRWLSWVPSLTPEARTRKLPPAPLAPGH